MTANTMVVWDKNPLPPPPPPIGNRVKTVSIEIKSLLGSKRDKRIIMFPLGIKQIMIQIRT